MTKPSDMTEAEITTTLTDIHRRVITLANERYALENELKKRAVASRGEAIAEALQYERFEVRFVCRPAVYVRLPDSDWIENEPDVQEVVDRVSAALSTDKYDGQTAMIGARWFSIQDEGGRFHVCPADRGDKDAWALLLSLVEHRILGNSSTRYDIECLDLVLPTIRDLAFRPKLQPGSNADPT